MRHALIFSLLISLASTSAFAFCEDPTPKLCHVLYHSDLVAHAKVIAKHDVVDRVDDPEGVEGWLYYMDVFKVYRGKPRKKLVVYSSNSTSRLILEPGKEYIIFASMNLNGMFSAHNNCGSVQDVEGELYSPSLESSIIKLLREKTSTIEGKVVDQNGDLILNSSIVLKIFGNGIAKTVAVNTRGIFSVSVKPGRYTIDIPKNLYVYDISPDGIDSQIIEGGQCIQIQLRKREPKPYGNK